MGRVVSLYLPGWPTDRLRRSLGAAAPAPDTPLVLIGREGRRRVVLSADRAAHAAGLRPGMPVTKAGALVPGLAVMDADPRADAAALDALAVWALRYSPLVATDPPDGLVLDTTGADHLHGGEDAMLAGLIERLAASGVTANAAVAESWGAAHALARYGKGQRIVAAPGSAHEHLYGLPVAALRLSAATVASLRVLGFERIGDLASTPRAPLTLRFGPELGRRLDQALDHAPEPIEPVRTPDLVEVGQVFAEPIGAPETITRYVAKLVDALCTALETRGLGARRLDLLIIRVDDHRQAIRIGTVKPNRDAKRLTRLLCDRIETVDPGFGIELMSLAATLAEPLDTRQVASSLVEEAEADVSGLIDVLANRVGERGLYRMAPVASDVPERSAARVAALAPDDGAGWPEGWPRPSRLLARPETIEALALLPDHPPVAFTWRGIRRRVRRADGPERVFGEWWRREAEMIAVRDYFQVEDDAGERYWIFRAGDGEDPTTGSHRWFLHGIFG